MTWLPRETVVVPIDFSEESFAALSTAAELAADPEHVDVLHVLPHLDMADPGVIWQTVDDESRRAHATDALSGELAKRDCRVGRITIRIGDPGREIAAYAEEVSAGLIAISSHGRSGLRRLLIGSVTDRVIHLAHCPVLVLRR